MTSIFSSAKKTGHGNHDVYVAAYPPNTFRLPAYIEGQVKKIGATVSIERKSTTTPRGKVIEYDRVTVQWPKGVEEYCFGGYSRDTAPHTAALIDIGLVRADEVMRAWDSALEAVNHLSQVVDLPHNFDSRHNGAMPLECLEVDLGWAHSNVQSWAPCYVISRSGTLFYESEREVYHVASKLRAVAKWFQTVGDHGGDFPHIVTLLRDNVSERGLFSRKTRLNPWDVAVLFPRPYTLERALGRVMWRAIELAKPFGCAPSWLSCYRALCSADRNDCGKFAMRRPRRAAYFAAAYAVTRVFPETYREARGLLIEAHGLLTKQEIPCNYAHGLILLDKEEGLGLVGSKTEKGAIKKLTGGRETPKSINDLLRLFGFRKALAEALVEVIAKADPSDVAPEAEIWERLPWYCRPNRELVVRNIATTHLPSYVKLAGVMYEVLWTWGRVKVDRGYKEIDSDLSRRVASAFNCFGAEERVNVLPEPQRTFALGLHEKHKSPVRADSNPEED